MSAAPTLVYWGINARGTPGYVVAALGGATLEWDLATANSWPAPKDTAPFGQLPLLKEGDFTLAQSFAIVRYLARKYDLQGSDLKTFGISEMITEEAADLLGGLAKSKYAADPLDAYNKYFNETVTQQLAYLDKLLHGDFYGGDKALQGDAALFSVFYLLKRCNASLFAQVLATAPKVEAWFARFAALPQLAKAIAHLDATEAYFTWPN